VDLSGPARLRALSVSRSKSVVYDAFVYARRALNGQKRRFPARAVVAPMTLPRAQVGAAVAPPCSVAPLPASLSPASFLISLLPSSCVVCSLCLPACSRLLSAHLPRSSWCMSCSAPTTPLRGAGRRRRHRWGAARGRRLQRPDGRRVDNPPSRLETALGAQTIPTVAGPHNVSWARVALRGTRTARGGRAHDRASPNIMGLASLG
jgi:hypothetical protein